MSIHIKDLMSLLVAQRQTPDGTRLATRIVSGTAVAAGFSFGN